MEEVHIPAAKSTSEFDGTEITTQSNDIARLVPIQICRCFFEKNRSISNEIVLIYCRNNIDASVAIRRKVNNGFHVLRKDLAQVGRYRRYIGLLLYACTDKFSEMENLIELVYEAKGMPC